MLCNMEKATSTAEAGRKESPILLQVTCHGRPGSLASIFLGGSRHELGIDPCRRDLSQGSQGHIRQLKDLQQETAESLEVGRDDLGVGASLQVRKVAVQRPIQ
jgi:hypothetical protein